MSGIHAAGDDVLDSVERRADPFAGSDHRPAKQIVRSQVRERPAVATDRRADPTEDVGVRHRLTHRWFSFS